MTLTSSTSFSKIITSRQLFQSKKEYIAAFTEIVHANTGANALITDAVLLSLQSADSNAYMETFCILEKPVNSAKRFYYE